ncbi:5-methyltetrahydropteroyltriglutamate--homocysteine S-methyltransferase [Novosphingobium sp. 1949]|uniref:5-methyltetrahydropteroyltriglutamate--homocysteine S-methyltransferase n=1 Tax=Novosphingobium organovorum TaxID=2930092 RepID=A0ABT0B8I0_9SPHN|nr:5-methyltetrahydropteroyltriglutamate--homocysteine S-methyltransferase [Novosphingobium organovorum]MCJ2181352.1 5-methyltetrahydropteroyltriglutamate--homocysteine S-methyltransferase [Novosphingobium organovorum]
MTKPRFRADHVGSLLRPAPIAAARAQKADPATLRAAEDAAIPLLIAMQEEVGLKVVTDGEARRAFWHFDFLGLLDGMEMRTREEGVQFHGTKIPPVRPVITGPLGFPADHPMLEHFRFVKDHTTACAKISIPGPSVLHYRTDPEDVLPAEYRDPDALTHAIAATYKAAVEAYYAAGCRYLQLDDIYFAYLGDPAQRALKQAQGYDPDALITRYAWMINEAIKDRPADMTIAMHMCRGNFRSTYAASGGYDAAADAIFNQTDVDIYFMEYDNERSGSLDPLRLLPKGDKRVMAGFITTKTPELEPVDAICRKIEEASRFAPLDQLGIAPQCGFASTEEGNAISPQDQRRKLELVVKVAQTVWGEA